MTLTPYPHVRPLAALLDDAAIKRFWSKVQRGSSTECWPWLAQINESGYGMFHLVTPARAHRVAYTLRNGEIPQGLVLDHLCRNPPCVNPDHLEAVMPGENTARGTARQALEPTYRALRSKTECVNGHPYTEENTYRSKLGRGCVECRRARSREYQRRRRGI